MDLKSQRIYIPIPAQFQSAHADAAAGPKQHSRNETLREFLRENRLLVLLPKNFALRGRLHSLKIKMSGIEGHLTATEFSFSFCKTANSFVASNSSAALHTSPLHSLLPLPEGAMARIRPPVVHFDNDPELSKALVSPHVNTPWLAKPSSRPSSRASTHSDYPGDKTVPRFLLLMRSHIRSEMDTLGALEAEPGDRRRLQVFREAFDFFIREFKTYKPILTEIKNEYETTIKLQRDHIDSLEPLKAKITIAEYEAAREMAKLRSKMLEEISSVTSDKRRLQGERDALHFEIESLKTQLDKTVAELRKNEGAVQSEELARARLKECQDQAEADHKQYADALEKKEDEKFAIEKALRKARMDSVAVGNEIVALKFKIRSYVPKADLEEVVAQNGRMVKEVAELKSKVTELNTKIEALAASIDKKEKIIKSIQVDKYPNWEYITYNCPGPIHEWGGLCKGLEFNDAIVILMRQLLFLKSKKEVRAQEAPKKDDKLDNRFFVGLGLGSDVPKYLRFKGKVPNRKLTKKNCCLLINDTWMAKAVFDANPSSNGMKSSVCEPFLFALYLIHNAQLAEFLFMYLKKRFGTQDAVAEWGYNLHEAAKKHGFQSNQAHMFFEILTGNMEEEVYHHQQAMIERVKSALQKHDTIINDGRAKGVLSKQDAALVLKEFWPGKTEADLDQLRNAIDADQPGDLITYQWLFQSDVDSLFLEIVREQYMDTREKYLREFTAKVGTITKDPRVSATDLARALHAFGERDRRELDAMVARGFKMSMDAIKPRLMIELDVFVKNIGRGVLEKKVVT
ncbi:Translin-associated factor X-interacting protein 1 [Irineochytrium annulatum]|nr:Translin-associated factor X-interacting protein 1 [Irineochytrium annulatum]